MKRAAALLFILTSLASFAQEEPAVHEIAGTGVSLTKPAGWELATATESLVVLQNPEVEGAAFVLTIQPMDTPPPNAAPYLLTYTLHTVGQNLADFKIEEEARATTVAGRHAAEATTSYTHTEEESSVPVRSRMILIPREGGILIINMAARSERFDASIKEMAGIVDSLKIAK